MKVMIIAIVVKREHKRVEDDVLRAKSHLVSIIIDTNRRDFLKPTVLSWFSRCLLLNVALYELLNLKHLINLLVFLDIIL